MRAVIEFLFPAKTEKDKKRRKFYFWYLLIAIPIAACLLLWVESIIKDYHSVHADIQKKQCLGPFDTVPCHQLRIEQLLLESRQKEL